MGKIRARADNEKLFFDFTYLDKRCREQTTLPDTPANRKSWRKSLSALRQKSRWEASTMPLTFRKAARFRSSQDCRLAARY